MILHNVYNNYNGKVVRLATFNELSVAQWFIKNYPQNGLYIESQGQAF